MSYLVWWSAVTVVITAVPITFTTRRMCRLFRKESNDKLIASIECSSASDEIGVGSVESCLPSNVIDPLSLL
jgi:hypothetical protein